MTIVFAQKIRMRLTLRKGYITQLGFSYLKEVDWKKLKIDQKTVEAWAQMILNDYPGLGVPIPCANGFIFQFDPEELKMKDIKFEDLKLLNYRIELRISTLL